jgi:hypothetical protein
MALPSIISLTVDYPDACWFQDSHAPKYTPTSRAESDEFPTMPNSLSGHILIPLNITNTPPIAILID